ncbi:hypothetical protein A9G24_07130 [Gilliamella sp. App6-5]|uniref:hypothetical protein n=1 Tax=Gilliamella sp. App6-5 TaxID=3120232 RepID=UPI00080E1281|nr:hypothetical protein [Gilliamella apicola]OCG13872.1 hypothetical protein A9G24_07130 [Gilliamella apicola]
MMKRKVTSFEKLTKRTSTALLGLIVSTKAIALSATTTNIIQGSAPYLSMDGGVTKAMSEEGLLGIKFPDGSVYIAPGANTDLYPDAKVDNSSFNTPITLPSEAKTFADIQTLVPLAGNSHYPRIDLNNLIGEPYNYWGDADGDGNASATGSLTVAWKNADNKDITAEIKTNPNKLLTACDMPYQLTITATNGHLSTEYGVPQTSTFNDISHTYYLGVKADKPSACYAYPNSKYDGRFSDIMDGPNWVAFAGFKVNDADKPSDNFPTTGADNLHFFLLLSGITAEQIIAANGATVSAESGHGVTLSLSADEVNWNDVYNENDRERWNARPIELRSGLKIKLKGPTLDSKDKRFSPSVFKLYADNSHTHLLYSFKIERWYINNPPTIKENEEVVYNSMTHEQAIQFCQGLDSHYRLPDVNDYTNSDYAGGGIPGMDYYYQRRLSFKRGNRWVGGLFNEWGNMTTLDPLDGEEAALQNGEYAVFWDWNVGLSAGFWTATQSKPNQYFSVEPMMGSVGDFNEPWRTIQTACVSP